MAHHDIRKKTHNTSADTATAAVATTGNPGADSAFRAFVNRHEIAFMIAGAAIVFLGFVVKEGYREQDRDLMSAIDGAATTFIVSSHLQQIAWLVQSVAIPPDDASADWRQLPKNLLKLTSEEQLNELTIPFENTVGLYATSISITDRMLTKLLSKTPGLEDKRSLEEQQVSAKEALKALRSAYYGRLTSAIKRQLNAAKKDEVFWALRERDVAKKEFYKAAIFLDGRLYLYNSSVLTSARKEQEKLERAVQLATNGSYALFLLGWGLGLLGRILKLPALSGGGA
jgi:hypothetical protein